MSATPSDWNAERMLELATRHARVEGQRRLDDLMDTLIEDPVYEFPVQGLTLRGGANVRRYYRQFFDDYMSRVSGAQLVGQWADEAAVAREDAIEVEGADGPEVQRVMSVGEAVNYDGGKPAIGLVPPEAIFALGEVLSAGAEKYASRNWELGMAYSRMFGSAQRHLWAYWGGEEIDEETGLSHLSLALCRIAMLIAYRERGIGDDDRGLPNGETKETTDATDV